MHRRLFIAGGVASAAAQVEDLDALARVWDQKRAQITTAEALERRNAFVRRRVRELLHVPASRPPVNAQVTSSMERDGYTITPLVYESGPDLWVSATLYVPQGKGPWPGVIVPCGHYELGRMYPDYQYACIELARAGFVVLIYDPQAQGERRALDPPMKSTEEHSLAGHVLALIGENLTAHMVRDGMCGIDYLLTRPEVDRKRIGCAGHSGGGTLTMFLACADERIGCAAINEGGTYHRWPVVRKADGGFPISDAEQNLFSGAIDGIDICDLHVAIAPRPLLVTIEEYAPAFNQTAEHIRARYELLAQAQRFATEEARARHAWTPKLRAATVQWFSKWLGGEAAPGGTGEVRAESPESLYATPNGKGKGRTIFSYVEEKAESLPARHAISRADVRRVLRLRETQPARTQSGHGPVLFVDEYLPDPARYADLTAAGVDVEPVTVRHVGPPAKSHVFDRETSLQYMAWYADRCLFADRVADVLGAIRHERVRLIGSGMGALLALYAAALDERVQVVVCNAGLLSYRAFAQCDRAQHGANIVVRGVLLHFDLPDVAALIAPRKLILRGPVDGMKQPVSERVAQSLYGPTVRVVPASMPYAECLA